MKPDEMKTSRIIGIQFSILSPEEIRKNSVAHITSREVYINNKPVVNGLFDPRMGVLEPGLVCPTDGNTYIDTPGYFGHIELARPVFAIQHIKEIVKICKCVCFKCSKLLIDKKKHKHILDYDTSDRWNYVCSLAPKIKRCGDNIEDGCGCKNPDRLKIEGMATINAIWDNITLEDGESRKVEKKLSPEIILKIFKRISDEDINFMGFSPVWSRPEWMIYTVLPVAPPAMRPSVKHDAQQRSEDDLTHIYSNIVKTNKDLSEKIANNANPNVIEGLTSVLQYFIAMIVNNKIKGANPMAQRSGRPLQCIMDRLNSKNGRIRGNLMGKRVDYSARSVITGDPNLSIRQLGVPMKIAMNITKPVKVNDRNRDFLTKLVQNGPESWITLNQPGAKILERKNGENISLRYVDRKSIRLENGDIVHRHMMDGDAVLFNRQPSLHRMSMMSHIVKIMKQGDTFRMNVGDTKPYNADFDGDEMNMHMPQNIMAETELKHLAAIPYQIVSPASNSPIIGIFQDSMLGSYQFTRPNVKFDPKTAMNLLFMYPDINVDSLIDKGKNISSFDLISQILPPISLKYKTALWNDDEDSETSNNILEIRNGEYLRGQMEKKVLGNTTKGMIHRIFNDYGNMAASNFIDNLQNIITEYVKTSSFSVGISDLIANKKTHDSILHVISSQKQEVYDLIDKLHLGIFENNTASSNMEVFEQKVNNMLNKATEKSGKIGRQSLNKNNRFLKIVESGSKGNHVNISQMLSCVGQTNIDGKRIPYGFDNRTLPHFKKYDDSPGARGFVENSYISGLTAPELFFHAMGGRVGLIDTAVKTSQTGYIQRRLIKGLEDLRVEYDMTVRNNKGKIVQFVYGDDGFDSTKIENQNIKLPEMSNEEIYLRYDIVGINEQEKGLTSIYTKGTITRIKKQKAETKLKCKKYIEYFIEKRDEIVQNVFNYKDETSIRMPISYQNIISNLQAQLNLNSNSIVDITPLEAFEIIESYFAKINSYKFIKENKLIEAIYYFMLNPRDLLVIKRFHKKGLILLLETVLLKYKQALVHPGEMVGIIAGQSIGEPTTQLTLNTFHLAGVSSKSNVTRGVPRIEEILRLTKNPKNPSLTVFLKSVDENQQSKAINIATMMEHTKLIDVINSAQICFDTNDMDSKIEEDREFLNEYYEFEKMTYECMNKDFNEVNPLTQKSKWLIRLQISPETLLEKNITMDDIHFAITNSYGDDITCVYSDLNSENLVFRLRLNSNYLQKNKSKKGISSSLDQTDEIYLLRNFQENILNNIVLRGIKNIDKVFPRKLQNQVKKKDEKFLKEEVWVLDTTGTNMLSVFALDYIDYTRTYSNDIKEIFNVLGIEATRQIIYNEFVDVMDFSSVYINYHHLGLLCDRMTCNKNLTAIFRSGILNDDIGPIPKSTFEVHTEVFLNAARHSEFDQMRSVSANIMTGQTGYFGTGAFSLILDLKEMEKNKNEELISTKKKSKTDLFDLEPNEDDNCANINIKNNISLINKQNTNDGCDGDDGYDFGF